jgi:DnaK suppressor protein
MVAAPRLPSVRADGADRPMAEEENEMSPTKKATAPPPAGQATDAADPTHASAEAAPSVATAKSAPKVTKEASAPKAPDTKTPVAKESRPRPPAANADGTAAAATTPPDAKPAKAPFRAKQIGPYGGDKKFLEEQRDLLHQERAIYLEQATDLKAEADSLAQEREPGDVQFDEESGEGGTITVDRERDLALSAQALAAVEEIDDAVLRIDAGAYGTCERCHQPIPKPRLRALPYARLCVACKSGGLSRR